MEFATEYATYGLITRPGAVPGGSLMAWFGDWLWFHGYALILTFFKNTTDAVDDVYLRSAPTFFGSQRPDEIDQPHERRSVGGEGTIVEISSAVLMLQQVD